MFICPCCGLPKHLEFSSATIYNLFKDAMINNTREGSPVTDYKNDDWVVDEETCAAIIQRLLYRFNYLKINAPIKFQNYNTCWDYLQANTIFFIKGGDSDGSI